jgi:hypothetical protein
MNRVLASFVNFMELKWSHVKGVALRKVHQPQTPRSLILSSAANSTPFCSASERPQLVFRGPLLNSSHFYCHNTVLPPDVVCCRSTAAHFVAGAMAAGRQGAALRGGSRGSCCWLPAARGSNGKKVRNDVGVNVGRDQRKLLAYLFSCAFALMSHTVLSCSP